MIKLRDFSLMKISNLYVNLTLNKNQAAKNSKMQKFATIYKEKQSLTLYTFSFKDSMYICMIQLLLCIFTFFKHCFDPRLNSNHICAQSKACSLR